MIERAPENKSRGIVWFPPDKRRSAPEVETPGPDAPPRNDGATTAQRNATGKPSDANDLRHLGATNAQRTRNNPEPKAKPE